MLPYALSDSDATIEFSLPDSENWVSGSSMAILDDGRNLGKKIVVNGKNEYYYERNRNRKN